MRENSVVERIKNKKVLNDKDIEILAEYTRQRFFGKAENA